MCIHSYSVIFIRVMASEILVGRMSQKLAKSDLCDVFLPLLQTTFLIRVDKLYFMMPDQCLLRLPLFHFHHVLITISSSVFLSIF